jgi:hypothetical protein
LKRKTKTRRLTCNSTLAVVLSLAAAACAGPERPLLEQFFAASRLRDRTALQSIATVIFEPRERGIITKFQIVRVDARSAGARDRKDVTITAPVALPNGQTIRKMMVVSMERDESGRWIVTAVDDPVLSRP